MKRKRWICFLSFIGAFFLRFTGFSVWIDQGTSKDTDFTRDVTKAVAYYGDKYFTSIEGAVNSAWNNGTNDTIYVIPGTTCTINESFTIKSGDTLIFPYSGTEYNIKYTKKEEGSVSGFADNNPSQYRKTQVFLSKGKYIQVNGQMIIGGQTGGAGPQGATNGLYTELIMDDNSSINLQKGGKLFCYGFIKEANTAGNARITAAEDSEIYEPVVIYDWITATKVMVLSRHGNLGSVLLPNIYNDIFPFNKYDFPNIRPTICYSYGSIMWGMIHTYGSNAGHFYTNAKILSKDDDSFAVMSKDEGQKSESKIYWHFKNDNSKTVDRSISATTNDGKTHKTTIERIGKCKLGKLMVDLEVEIGKKYEISIDSSNYYLPLPYLFEMIVGKDNEFGSVSIPNKVKFLPGFSLTIKKGSNISFDNNVVFYQKNLSDDSSNYKQIPYYDNDNPAQFVNFGEVKINSGFGGVVTPGGENASVLVGPNYCRVTDCYEGEYTGSGGKDTIGALSLELELNGSGNGKKYGPYESTGGKAQIVQSTYSFDDSSQAVLCFDADIGQNEINKNQSYISKKLTGGKYYWSCDYYDNYGIHIVKDSNMDIDDPNKNEKHFNFRDNLAIELDSLTTNDSSKTFAGYFYDSNLSDELGVNSSGKYYVDPSHVKDRGYLGMNKYINIYPKWVQGGMIEIRQYRNSNSSNEFVSTNLSLKTQRYSLSALGINGNDSRMPYKVSNKCRTTYDFEKWILYKVSDSVNKNNVLVNDSFTPENGESYILEPVFKETYYLWMDVKNDQWKVWEWTKYVTYFYIYNCSIDEPNPISGSFKVNNKAESSTTETSFTAGWVSENATFSFKIENRTKGNSGPNHLCVLFDKQQQGKFDGNESGSYSGQVQQNLQFSDEKYKTYFTNGSGPILLQATNG